MNELFLTSLNFFTIIIGTSLFPPIIHFLINTWLETTSIFILKNVNHTYDYIIVGGGAAGSVVTNRLSEDANVTVLLVEAGGLPSPYEKIPMLAIDLPLTKYDWNYKATPQEKACYGLKHRISFLDQGKGLGGSTILNYMVYTKGNKKDYDYWASLGAVGWNWENVKPYFLKLENNLEPLMLKNGHHGIGGYVPISYPKFITKMDSQFLKAAKEIGYRIDDPNAERQDVFSILPLTQINGHRASAASNYLKPILHRRNLHILIDSFVTRILFKNKRAIGIEYDKNGETHRVYARKEVIISAGALGTPKLLLLSGIGPRKDLEKLDIPVIADLPVGRNLMDHLCSLGLHYTINISNPFLLVNSLSPINLLKYLFTNEGPLSSTGVGSFGFAYTPLANKTDLWPDIEIILFSLGLNSDKGLTFRIIENLNEKTWKAFAPYMDRDSIALLVCLLRPESRGFVKLRSKNPYSLPIINPRYFSNPSDMKILTEGMKIAHLLTKTNAFQEIDAKIFKTKPAYCKEEKLESPAYLACLTQTISTTLWHYSGTAKMGDPLDKSAVVDPQLRVLGGIKSLRVVDGSIMPQIISGHPMIPIYMIAEKASDMIKGKCPECL